MLVMLKFQLQFQKLRQCSIFAPGMISFVLAGSTLRDCAAWTAWDGSGGTQPFWPKSASCIGSSGYPMNRIFISIGVFALLISTSETARAMCNNLVAVGDSITAGNDKYPTLIASSLRSHALIRHMEEVGGAIWQLVQPKKSIRS